jgi:ABC-2 type transport system ATP-binding protein
MFEVKNISKSFKGKNGHFWEKQIEILKNLNFSIEEAKITGFLGANGAGKTTFLKIFFKFLSQDSGHFNFNPSLGHNFKEVLSRVGYLPERPYFHQHLTGTDFLRYMGDLSKVNRRDLASRIDRWSGQLKIDHALDRDLKFYSKGMLQRLGFLSTLIHDPLLVILDEPLSGLDPLGRKELKDIMLEIKSEGKTVFFSSHIVSDVEEVSDNVVFMKDGVIEYAGDILSLIKESTDDSLYNIEYYNKELIKKEVELINLESEIKNLIKSNSDILSIKKKSKNLEEIFYISNR